MVQVLATVSLPHKSGLNEDRVVNTFAFYNSASSFTQTDATAMGLALNQFYNVIPSGLNAIAGWIGPQISRTAPVEVKMTDITGHLDGSAHGSPDFEDGWNLGAMVPGALPLPSEVCVALTLDGSVDSEAPEFGPGGTRPKSQLRGRIYLGPVTHGATVLDGLTGRVSVSTQLRSSWLAAAEALRENTTWNWAVWSRKGAFMTAVDQNWVDDAFDTQRRRGERTQSRTFG